MKTPSLAATALLPLVLAWAPLAAAQPTAAPVEPQPSSIDGATTHLYKVIHGTELRLHVFDPPDHSAASTSPAIVFFFGGGWTRGDVRHFVPQARHLAQGGMVAIVADYRVSGRHGTTPFEAVADAKSAIRWVRSRAQELGIDPDRIAAGGGSAGGHLALSAAVLEGFDEPGEDRRISSKPNALVLFNPAVDTSTKPEFGERPTDGSPYHHLGPGLPPALILHGKEDEAVPFADVERFCARTTELGNRCELVGYEGAGHGFFNPQNEDGKWYRKTLVEVDRFLTAIGYLPAPGPEVQHAAKAGPAMPIQQP